MIYESPNLVSVGLHSGPRMFTRKANMAHFTRIVEVADSSNITHVMYDPKEKKVSIRFKNKDNYVYHDVPAHQFGMLVSAPSVGGFFQSSFRTQFTGSKIGDK